MIWTHILDPETGVRHGKLFISVGVASGREMYTMSAGIIISK